MTVKLFNHQHQFVSDLDHRYIALIAGFGAGKSFAFCMKALHLAATNAKEIGDHVGIICEPTYPLINDVLIPSMEEVMEIAGIHVDHLLFAPVHLFHIQRDVLWFFSLLTPLIYIYLYMIHQIQLMGNKNNASIEEVVE